MNSVTIRMIGIAVCVFFTHMAPAAAAQDTPAAPASQPGPNAEIPALKKIIINTEDSLPTRIAQATKLISIGTPEAIQTAIELLAENSHASTRKVICKAIASLGESNPNALKSEATTLAAPLLNLLGSQSNGLAGNAAEALDAFPDTVIISQVAEVAGNPKLPISHRLAAVEILSHKAYDAEVVETLIQLIGKNNGNFRPNVIKILRVVTGQNLGDKPEPWQKWWTDQKKDGLEAWYKKQTKVFYTRMAESEKQWKQRTTDSQKRYDSLNGRFAESLRTIYRLTQKPDEKNKLLATWLADSNDVYKQTALAILKDAVQDGTLPTADVAVAVQNNLSHSSPAIRQKALAIIGAMANPASADKVIQALETEDDLAIRETALRVLGQLKNPAAIPALLEDLKPSKNGATKCPACLMAAAHSLGILAAKGKVEPAVTKTTLPVLQERLQSTPPEQADVRESILRAMADICDPGFLPAFKAELKPSNAPQILLVSLQGISCLKDQGSLEPIVDLLSSTDARVRTKALNLIEKLDSAGSSIGAVTSRINPANESNEGVRNSAWTTARAIMSKKPPAEQLAWTEQLAATPDRAIAWLEDRVAQWSAAKPPPAELPAAKLKLASLLEAHGQWAKALKAWQQLVVAKPESPQAYEADLHVLIIALRLNNFETAKAEAIKLGGAEATIKDRARKAICDHMSNLVDNNKKDLAQNGLTIFRTIPAETYGGSLKNCLDAVNGRLNPPPPPVPAAAPEKKAAEKKPAPPAEKKPPASTQPSKK